MKLRYPLALLLIICFLAVSESDFNEEVKEEQRYAQRVCSGVHSNYLELRIDCEKISRFVSRNSH